MRFSRYILACVFAAIFCGLYHETLGAQELEQERVTHIDCLSDFYKQQLENCLPETFYLKSVSCDIDFSYDPRDLQYLTKLEQDVVISRDQLFSACFYLRQVDRFKKVDLRIEPSDSGYILKFELSGHMLFSRLSISGFARNKDVYKNMYLLDISERFDEHKHQCSLEQIKQVFYDKGYCNVQLIDTIKRDDKNKKVSVHIDLKKGPVFTIEKASFVVSAVGSCIAQSDVLRMQKTIEDICEKRLVYKIYKQETIKKVKAKIKGLLHRYGFMNFEINLLQQVNQVTHRANITFKIVLERKKEFVFFGNHFFSQQEILEQLLMYGKSSWHFPQSIIIDEVQQLYKSKGFWDVQVSIREEKDRVFCLINEGKRISISHVYFKDNDHVTSLQLERQVFKKFLKERYFDKESLKKSIDQLIRFYKQQGFWDIKVLKEEFVTTKQPRSFDLVLTLDEGLQRNIGSYKVEGHQELEHQGPFVQTKNQEGTGFDPMIILEQKQWLTRYFKNKGYLRPVVDYNLQEQDNNLDVVWDIKLDEQAIRFGKPLITGNSVVPSSYILREIAFKQGDVWDKAKLEESLKNLRALDVFESVQVYPSREVDKDLEKPIFIKVVDASRYEVRTRMGAQQVGNSFVLKRGFTYKMGASFFLKNPFHYGDKFALETNFTRFYRDFAATYQYPWVFGHTVRCQHKLYDNVYDQPVYIGSKYSLYQAVQRGFLFNMTKAYPEVSVSGTAGIEYMGIRQADEPDLGSIIDYQTSLLGRTLGYIFFEPNVVWQKMDNVVNPKKGHLSYISLKAMIDLNCKTSFFKLLIEHSWYTPLVEPLILGVRIRGGHVFNREYKQLIPIERFYLGGESTIRAYNRDYCPPLGELTVPIVDPSAGLPPAACDTWRYAPQGGRTMFNINTELRFPVYKGLKGAIFTDVGGLFKDSITDALKDKSDSILGATGFGFRYDTPIGPLRFDLGFKWDRQLRDFERRYMWYLTFGQAF